ncbi:MAG: PD-(D/E)XK nuclease family protein [Methanocella sp.]
MTKLTHSKQVTFRNCRRAYQYRFERCMVPKQVNMPRLVGSAVHKGLETGDIDEAMALFGGVYPSSQEEQDALDTDMAIARAILEGYAAYFAPIPNLRPEVTFELPIINPATKAHSKKFVLAGKADGIAKQHGGYWLVEYKTAGQIDKDYVDKLSLDSQITTYSYALSRVLGAPIVGTIYRVMRKPSIRRTAKETARQFQDRLIRDYQERPEFYFHEFTLYRDQEDLEIYEHELWQLTQDILQCRLTGRWYKNTSRCADWGKCAYMPLCLGHECEGLYVSQDPDIELKEAEANGDCVAC